MATIAVTVAVMQEGKVLLTKRKDFEVWCLPGGGVEEGESVAQAAIREVREETGLEIVLTRLVGVYSIPTPTPFGGGGSLHNLTFAGEVVGGVLAPQPSEVLEIRYFAPDELPAAMTWTHRQRIADALGGVGGSVVWEQRVGWPLGAGVTRQEVYALRDESGLSKQAFYAKYLAKPDEEAEVLVVGNGG